jgi:hypothetical protein
MGYIAIEDKKFSRDPRRGVQVPKTLSSDIRKLTLEISLGITYYYNSMKNSRFCWGRKNGLIRPRPLIVSETFRTEVKKYFMQMNINYLY